MFHHTFRQTARLVLTMEYWIKPRRERDDDACARVTERVTTRQGGKPGTSPESVRWAWLVEVCMTSRATQ